MTIRFRVVDDISITWNGHSACEVSRDQSIGGLQNQT